MLIANYKTAIWFLLIEFTDFINNLERTKFTHSCVNYRTHLFKQEKYDTGNIQAFFDAYKTLDLCLDFSSILIIQFRSYR